MAFETVTAVPRPTAWKEAGVAAISIYTQDEEGNAARLDTRYVARMPQSGMVRLLDQMNAVVAPLLNRELRAIVILCDGKEAIWTAATKLECYPMASDCSLLMTAMVSQEHRDCYCPGTTRVSCLIS